MAITVTERQDSRERVTGASASVTLYYVIKGTASVTDATDALGTEAPLSFDWLVRRSREVRPIFIDADNEAVCTWEGVAHYGAYAPVEPPETGDSTYQFDTGGGTEHITQSIATIARYKRPTDPKPAPNHHGAIGVAGDNIEGVDITVPTYNWSETHYIATAYVTQAYRLTLANLTGHVNMAPFRGFAGGEVLFLNAQGAVRGEDDWEISYRFAAQPNRSGIVVGTITGITKRGWEYMWVQYLEEKDAAAKAAVRRPKSVYIEQVYYEADFALIGIGS